MDKELVEKERLLESLALEEEISARRMTIAQRKAVEREMRQKHGRDWKKVLGYVGGVARGLKPDVEKMQDLYGVGLKGRGK